MHSRKNTFSCTLLVLQALGGSNGYKSLFFRITQWKVLGLRLAMPQSLLEGLFHGRPLGLTHSVSDAVRLGRFRASDSDPL